MVGPGRAIPVALAARALGVKPIVGDLDIPASLRRLAGRHGRDLPRLARLIRSLGSECVGASDTLWAELAFAAEAEMVLHLDDLLLRRTRLGLLLPDGAAHYLPDIRRLCQPRLGWDDTRWEQEQQRYLQLWQRHHSVPSASI